MISEKDLMKLQNGSDIRGVAVEGVADEPVNLTNEAVNRIAGGFAEFLAQKTGKATTDLKVAIGRDSRISGKDLVRAAIKGMAAKGLACLDCGLASTPAMFMSTIFDETQADGAIMVTASHLPYNRNGMKFFTKDGGLEHEDIANLLQRAVHLPEREASLSRVQAFDLMSIYAAHLRKKICEGLETTEDDAPLADMHVVVDAGNGTGGFFASQVLDVLGAETKGSRYLDPDGMFPNHIPNPENKQAMAAIREAVLESKADLGLIFDTDVDRMSAVLPDGQDISRNALIAIMAAILAPYYPGSSIVTDSVTSDELTQFLEQELGLKHHRYMRGYRNVIGECMRLNASGTVSPMAIETSGHGALKENYYLDDGAYLAVKLLIATAKAKKAGRELKDLIAQLGHPAESREYRLRIQGVDDAKAYGATVLQEFEMRAAKAGVAAAKPSFEGVRLVFPGGWALLRMSLHDPNMPLNVEAKESGGVAAIVAQVKEFLAGFDKLDFSMLNK